MSTLSDCWIPGTKEMHFKPFMMKWIAKIHMYNVVKREKPFTDLKDLLLRCQSTVVGRNIQYLISSLSPPYGSVQETRQADGFPAHLHEVQTHQTEAETERHPERTSVRLRSRRASPQFWPRWYGSRKWWKVWTDTWHLLKWHLCGQTLVPQVLKSCSEFIEKHGVVDGIYRHSGVSSNIQKLRCVTMLDVLSNLLFYLGICAICC